MLDLYLYSAFFPIPEPGVRLASTTTGNENSLVMSAHAALRDEILLGRWRPWRAARCYIFDRTVYSALQDGTTNLIHPILIIKPPELGCL